MLLIPSAATWFHLRRNTSSDNGHLMHCSHALFTKGAAPSGGYPPTPAAAPPTTSTATFAPVFTPTTMANAPVTNSGLMTTAPAAPKPARKSVASAPVPPLTLRQIEILALSEKPIKEEIILELALTMKNEHVTLHIGNVKANTITTRIKTAIEKRAARLGQPKDVVKNAFNQQRKANGVHINAGDAKKVAFAAGAVSTMSNPVALSGIVSGALAQASTASSYPGTGHMNAPASHSTQSLAPYSTAIQQHPSAAPIFNMTSGHSQQAGQFVNIAPMALTAAPVAAVSAYDSLQPSSGTGKRKHDAEEELGADNSDERGENYGRITKRRDSGLGGFDGSQRA